MRRSAALCLGLLLGIVGRAHATSTLAWSKVVDVNTSGLAIECADAFGNLYASFSALGYFTVTKFDPYGAQVWSNSEFAGHAFAVYLIAADPVGNVYALGVENTTTTPQTLDLFKFGVDGTP